MVIKPIKTEDDYKIALKRIELIFDAAIGTTDRDEANILGLMIDEYEKKHDTIEAPDPIEAIKIRIEEMQFKQIVSESQSFDFLNNEEEIYSVTDLKEVYKG